jgi:hypothetical protein
MRRRPPHQNHPTWLGGAPLAAMTRQTAIRRSRTASSRGRLGPLLPGSLLQAPRRGCRPGCLLGFGKGEQAPHSACSGRRPRPRADERRYVSHGDSCLRQLCAACCRPAAAAERLQLRKSEPPQPAPEPERSAKEPVIKRGRRLDEDGKKTGSVFQRLAGMPLQKDAASAASHAADKPRRTTLASTVQVSPHVCLDDSHVKCYRCICSPSLQRFVIELELTCCTACKEAESRR